MDVNKSMIRASQISISIAAVHGMAMFVQLVRKMRLIRKHGKSFDRYNSLDMHSIDRMVANLIEWSIIFLPLVWSLGVTGNLDDTATRTSMTYVGLRGFYVALVSTFGVRRNGINVPLWIATFPSYGCLTVLLFKALHVIWTG